MSNGLLMGMFFDFIRIFVTVKYSIRLFGQYVMDEGLADDIPKIYDLTGTMIGDMLLHQRNGVPTLKDFIPCIKIMNSEKVLISILRTIVRL
jgi:hypothetical protein